MSTELTWRTESTSSEDTLRIGSEAGRNLRGGEVVELRGDLGSGKTTFVKGVAKGMGSQDSVHSPSFTLSNEYKAGKLTLYHFDFYRLSEPGIMRREIAEALDDPRGVVLVEWADIVEDALPRDHVSISIQATGEDIRQLSFSVPAKYQYLFPEKG